MSAEPDGGTRDADEDDVADVPDALLFQAMDLALAVAVAGARLRPPLSSPSALRPFLKFNRLAPTAVASIRSVVAADAEFRQRVASIATEKVVGPAGLLWLRRPDGWRDHLRGLAAQHGSDAPSTKAERRRREAAEHGAAKAVAELAVLRAASEADRLARAAMENTLQESNRQRDRLQQQLGEALRSADSARERLAQSQQRLADMQAEVDDLRVRFADIELSRDEALASRAEAELLDGRGTATTSGAEGPDAASRARAAARSALESATAEIRRVANGLEIAATGLALPEETGAIPPSLGGDGSSRRRREPRRTPMAIPGGLHGDTVAAAVHLLRQHGVLTIVDGYNVAILGWPELTLEQQRVALLQLLDDLVRRYGARIVVVFDGTNVGAYTGTRRLVRVVFTAHGVTADDEIRRLVHSRPSHQPLIVVTNDRAIINDVRPQGVNSVSSDTFLAVLRR